MADVIRTVGSLTGASATLPDAITWASNLANYDRTTDDRIIFELVDDEEQVVDGLNPGQLGGAPATIDKHLLIRAADGNWCNGRYEKARIRGTGPSNTFNGVENFTHFLGVAVLQAGGGGSDEAIRLLSGTDRVLFEKGYVAFSNVSDQDGFYAGNWGVSNITIVDSVLFGGGSNSRSCVHAQRYNGSSAQSWQVIHCTINGNGTDNGLLIMASGGNNNVTIEAYNNLVFSCSSAEFGYQSGGTTGFTGEGNISQGISATSNIVGANNLSNIDFLDVDADTTDDFVLLADIANGDYNLVDSAFQVNLAVGTAQPVPASDPRIDWTIDVVGNPRPLNGQSIGALEPIGVQADQYTVNANLSLTASITGSNTLIQQYTTSAQVALTSNITATGGGLPFVPLQWEELPNTSIQSLNACVGDQCAWTANQGFEGFTNAWNGGVIIGNKFVLFGGGHQSYYGNEVITFDLDNHTSERFTDPSPFNVNGTTPGTLPDGRPGSRHTYNSLAQWNETHLYVMGDFGGSSSGDSFGDDVWSLDVTTTPLWIDQGQLETGGGTMRVGYTLTNRVTNKIYYHKAGGGRLSEYDPPTNTHTFLIQEPLGTNATGAMDTTRNKALVVGGNNSIGWAWDFNTTPPVLRNLRNDGTWPVGGIEEEVYTLNQTGLDYDPINDAYLAWEDTAQTFYVIDADTYAVTKITPTGGAIPGAASENGTWGRLRYYPGDGYFYLLNSTTQNFFRISLGGNLPQQYSVTGSIPLTASITSTGDLATQQYAAQANLALTASIFATGDTAVQQYTVQSDYQLTGSITATGDTATQNYTVQAQYDLSGSLTATGDTATQNYTIQAQYQLSGSVTATGDEATQNYTVAAQLPLTAAISSVGDLAVQSYAIEAQLPLSGDVVATGDTATQDYTIDAQFALSGDVTAVGDNLTNDYTLQAQLPLTGNVIGTGDIAVRQYTVQAQLPLSADITAIGDIPTNDYTLWAQIPLTASFNTFGGFAPVNYIVQAGLRLTGNISAIGEDVEPGGPNNPPLTMEGSSRRGRARRIGVRR